MPKYMGFLVKVYGKVWTIEVDLSGDSGLSVVLAFLKAKSPEKSSAKPASTRDAMTGIRPGNG